MAGPLRALVIGDSPEDVEVLGRHLRRSGYALTLRRVDSPAALKQALAAEPWDVALYKYVMPDLNGPDTLAILRAEAPDLPTIAVAEHDDDEVALEVMRAGARDCVSRSNLARLTPVIDREVHARRAAVQADGALRMASSWLRLAQDSTIVGFFFHDLRSDTMTFSAQWCANLGYEPRELTEGRADFEARLHPLDLDEVRRFLRNDTAAGRGAASREFRLRQRDGSYRWVLARTAVEVDGNGKPFRVVGVHVDVTDRKRAEEVLALQAAVTNLMAEGVCMMRVRDARILYANPAFERIFGYAAGELIGHPPEVLNATTPDRSAEETAREIRECLLATGQWSGEVYNRRKDGSTFWSRATVSTAQHPEHGEVWVTAQHDITERPQLETERIPGAAGQGIVGLDRRAGVEFVDAAEWLERLVRIQHELARTVASTSDLREGLDACLDAALAVTGFDAGGFYALDESSGALDLLVHRGVSPAFAARMQHFDAESVQARLVRAGAPQYRRFADMELPWRDVELDEGLVGLALVPLEHQGKVIGSLSLGSHSVGALSPLGRQALEVIAAESGQMLHRLQVEAALRAGEARMRVAVEGAELGTWHWDPRTGDVLLSGRCLLLLGIPAGTRMAPLEYLRTIHPDDRDRVMANLRHVRETCADLDIEFRTLRPDGTVRWLVSRGRCSEVDAGRAGRIEGVLLDVTRLREAEAAAQRSEQVLRLFVEHAPAGIAMLDRDVRFLAVSQRYLEDHGLGDQSVVGRSLYDVLPDFPDHWRDVHRRCLAGATEREEEAPFPRADGRVDWVRWEVHPWFEASGVVGGLIVFVELITARKRAEVALRQSEERLRLALDAAHMGTFDWDVRSDRITWTRRHEQIWGYAPGEFAGTYAAFSERVHPDDLAALDAEVQRCIATRTDYVRDFRVVWPDGSVHWVSGRGSFTFDDDGTPLRMRGVVVDVSDLRLTEAALRVSEREFQSLFANMVEGVLQAQMVFEGGRPTDLILLSVNPAFDTLTGLTNVVGKPLSEILPGYAEIHPDVMEKFGRVAQTGTREHMEAYVEPLGRWLSASVYSTTPGQLILVFQNVTERKEAEARLQALNAELTQRVAERTADLEAVNRELEAFNYSISHDLRAPVRHIDGFIGALEEDFAPELPAEAVRYISLVRAGARRMEGMIEALLRLSRVGRAALEPRRCSPGAIARSAFDELRVAETERSVDFEVDPLPEVTADPALLRQVYDNLLANALKFTRPVPSARIEVGCERCDGRDVFYVRDNGVGFDAGSAVKLFHVFQRLHPSEQFEGTGVGLSIVRRIVERHDGHVWAESSPGQGATFYFTLGTA